MAQTKWIRQSRHREAPPELILTLRKRSFSMNAALAATLTARHKFAEILLSEDGRQIALEFMRKQTEFSFPLGASSRTGNTRTIDAADLIRDNRHLAALARDGGDAARIRMQRQGDLLVGDLPPAFCYDGAREPARNSDMGVFRLFVGANVVLIGDGNIKSEVTRALSENLPFDSYDYFLTDTPIAAFECRTRIVAEYRAKHGDLPLLNKKLARKGLSVAPGEGNLSS